MGQKREVTILLTTEEYEQLQCEANQLTASVPDLLRHYALKKPLPNAMLTKTYWKLCQINETIQVIIDQVIQKQKSEASSAIDVEQLRNALEQIKAFQRHIVGTQASETVAEPDNSSTSPLQ